MSLLIAAAVLVVLVVGHDLSVRIWPWRKCGACGGAKTILSPSRQNYRKCRVCVGKGERRRRMIGGR